MQLEQSLLALFNWVAYAAILQSAIVNVLKVCSPHSQRTSKIKIVMLCWLCRKISCDFFNSDTYYGIHSRRNVKTSIMRKLSSRRSEVHKINVKNMLGSREFRNFMRYRYRSIQNTPGYAPSLYSRRATNLTSLAYSGKRRGN